MSTNPSICLVALSRVVICSIWRVSSELGRDVRAHQLLVEHPSSRRELVTRLPVGFWSRLGKDLSRRPQLSPMIETRSAVTNVPNECLGLLKRRKVTSALVCIVEHH